MMYSGYVALQLLCLLHLSSVGKYEQSGVIQQEPDKHLQEIFQSWSRDNDNFESYYFEIAVEQESAVFHVKSTSKRRVALMVRPNGNCLVKYDTLNEQNKLLRTTIFQNNNTIDMDYTAKKIYLSEAATPYTKQTMAKLCDVFFPAVPFFITQQTELAKKYKLSLIQHDDHYTWIKFEPQTHRQQREMTIGQMGVINYTNSVSPKHFPLKIVWREPGDDCITWSFTKVLKNSQSSVSESTFVIDLKQLQKDGWKVQIVSPDGMQAMLWWLKVVDKSSSIH